MNWIVCPVRNALRYTKAALPTFLAQDIGDVRVLLLDNDSTDGTGHWARAQEGVLYWHRRPPLSVAASWNLCLKWLFGEQRQERVLLANNDVLLKPETFRLLDEDGGLFVTATGVNTMEQFSEQPTPASKRRHPDFSMALIRKQCWETVGQFDECFDVAFYEDNSYHVRMHRSGIDAYSIGVPFFHVGSATIKSADVSERDRISNAAARNKELFFTMYGCYPATPEYEALFNTASA